MHINPRTYNILMAIRKAAFDEHSFAMPEILRHWKEDDRARAGWSHE